MHMEQIKELCQRSALKWSTHYLERMQERDISLANVKKCIMGGGLIEDYPTDFPHPNCLIFGYTTDNTVLHVVEGTDGAVVVP